MNDIWERVTRQSLGWHEPGVPLVLPLLMRCVDQFDSNEQMDGAMRGYDAQDFVQQGNYEAFIHDTLMPPFSFGVLPCSLQKKSLFSPIRE